MANSPNYDKYCSVLENKDTLELYFYNADDRAHFLKELAQRTQYKKNLEEILGKDVFEQLKCESEYQARILAYYLLGINPE